MAEYDLLIIGGGINGVGIARDAAGRGLKVILCEQDDLASATSSASSKLIHGGLRYLENFEFSLVAEALSEREILLRAAPHIVKPLAFVLPHTSGLRSSWMIRLGFLFYDYLGGYSSLHPSKGIQFSKNPYVSYRVPLKSEFEKGFLYWDAQVDDARLVILNARSAVDHGATVLTRTRLINARRIGKVWRATLENINTGEQSQLMAQTIVNATGPWVRSIIDQAFHQTTQYKVRLVKGSHIVVRRLYEGDHAYVLQNFDQRVIFLIPYQNEFTLIGTTEEVVQTPATKPEISEVEKNYLCEAANRFLINPVTLESIVWSYSGIRALFDDGSESPSAVSRDYFLAVDEKPGLAPLISIYGGKITTYRKLAERALKKLKNIFPTMGAPWTHMQRLPGGDFNGDIDKLIKDLGQRYSFLPESLLKSLAKRHGTLTHEILQGIKDIQELGASFGCELYEQEILYFINKEWAKTADDILWRRTKLGLYMQDPEKQHLLKYMENKFHVKQ